MVSPLSSKNTGWSLSSRISSTSVATWASEPRTGRLRASLKGSTCPWRSEVWRTVSRTAGESATASPEHRLIAAPAARALVTPDESVDQPIARGRIIAPLPAVV